MRVAPTEMPTLARADVPSAVQPLLQLDEEFVSTLESRVLQVFCNDPILAERPIDISAFETDGVELTGWVHSAAEIAHALTLARGVPGVSKVVDHLAVQGREPQRVHSTGNYAAVSEPPAGTPPPRAD
jgi:hypothetical protein